MTEPQTASLSTDEIKAVKFAVRRQLGRWRGRELEPERRKRRKDLTGALHVLEEFPEGCELHGQDPAGR